MTAGRSDNLLKHGGIMLAATLIGGVANYLYHFVMIRLLTPADYGTLYSLFAVIMIIGVPVGTISIVIAKYVSRYEGAGEEKKISKLVKNSVKKLSLVGMAVLGLFCLLSRPLGDYLKIQDISLIIMIGAILALTFVATVGVGGLQGLQRFTYLGVFNVIGPLGKIAFGATLVLMNFGVIGALTGVLIANLAGIFIAFFPLKNFLAMKYDKGEVHIEKKEIYQYLVPVAISVFCFGFLTYYDVIAVKHYFSPEMAGYYSTCALIGKAFLFPPIAFAAALFPKVSALHAAGKNPFSLLKKAMLVNVGVLLIGVIICLSIPGFLIDVLLKGKDISAGNYSDMVVLMRIFGLMVVPYGLLNLIIYYNLAVHRVRFLFFLGGGALLLIAALFLFHYSLLQVVLVFGAVGYALFIISFIMVYSTKEVEGEGVQGEDLYINAGV
ncbi:oligosaccharide flippase family protein [Candidatus Auribacterota bacterium]